MITLLHGVCVLVGVCLSCVKGRLGRRGGVAASTGWWLRNGKWRQMDNSEMSNQAGAGSERRALCLALGPPPLPLATAARRRQGRLAVQGRPGRGGLVRNADPSTFWVVVSHASPLLTYLDRAFGMGEAGLMVTYLRYTIPTAWYKSRPTSSPGYLPLPFEQVPLWLLRTDLIHRLLFILQRLLHIKYTLLPPFFRIAKLKNVG